MIWWDQAGLGLGQVETGKETETEADTEEDEDGEGGKMICRGRWRRGGDWKGRRDPGQEIGH